MKVKLKAYLSPYAQIKAHELKTTTMEHLLSAISIVREGLDMGPEYTPVGDVEAELHLYEHSDIVGNKITSLRDMADKLRAASQRELTRIEGEIQSLLSISMEPRK